MKKCSMEILLYILIILSPIFDCLSFFCTKSGGFSWVSIVRLVIPIILFIYLFIKEKKIRKWIVFGTLLLLLYGIIHLWIFSKLLTAVSFGNLLQEMHYIFNYSYNLYLFVVVFFFVKNGKLVWLNNALFGMLLVYLLLLYLALLTGTSNSTYLDGVGYRGWFLSGNSLGTILLLLSFVLLPNIVERKRWYGYLMFFLTGIYLIFLLGTRTGFYGFILLLLIFSLYFLLKKLSFKKFLLIIFMFIVIGGSIFFCGTSTSMRQKNLVKEQVKIVDINTGENGHTTGDTFLFVYEIRNGLLDENYMNKPMQNAYLNMYHVANKWKIRATNLRCQQFLYHFFLMKNYKSILLLLFGNGYVNSYGEMILEMEFFALLFNFGLLGICLYLVPFIVFFVYILKKWFVKRKIDLKFVCYLLGIVLNFCLSCLAGYVLYSSSCVLVFICLLCLLYKECCL